MVKIKISEYYSVVDKDKIKQDIGARVKYYRTKRNLTQEALADKAKVHPTYIAFIETGKRICSVKTLHKIASALNISVDKLLKDQENLPEKIDPLTKKILILLDKKPDTDKRFFIELLRLIYKREKGYKK